MKGNEDDEKQQVNCSGTDVSGNEHHDNGSGSTQRNNGGEQVVQQ